MYLYHVVPFLNFKRSFSMREDSCVSFFHEENAEAFFIIELMIHYRIPRQALPPNCGRESQSNT